MGWLNVFIIFMNYHQMSSRPLVSRAQTEEYCIKRDISFLHLLWRDSRGILQLRLRLTFPNIICSLILDMHFVGGCCVITKGECSWIDTP